MRPERTKRVNSLLQEVIAEVLQREVKNPEIHPMTSITRVEVSKDLHHAKVFVSILASDKERRTTLSALQGASGFIAVKASKKVVIRYFPELSFYLDDTVEKQQRIEGLIADIQKERDQRGEAEE